MGFEPTIRFNTRYAISSRAPSTTRTPLLPRPLYFRGGRQDFRAQLRRTFANITALLESEGASWQDIVRTTCYLRDIERDYAAFNEERSAFYRAQELDPLPASKGIQAILCRPDLLVEIEAIALFRTATEAKE